ncbi:MAG: UDP-glucose 4-epimerase GalE [Bacteroidota bacterium]
MPTIIITGGCGYIGSHTAIELLANPAFEVVSIDSCVNSEPQTVQRVEQITGRKFTNHLIDTCDLELVRKVFEETDDVQGIIHFAALKAVGDSVKDPLGYYHNNFESLINLLRCSEEFSVPNFIFSSSCTVYGDLDESHLPVTENTPITRAASPYGNTKLVGEQIIQDFTIATPTVNCISLRYFNPVGAHTSGLNGELPSNRPNNLVPFITQTAAGILPQLTVFGGDYHTRDGSCVRDYIHVTDIATAHVKALEYLLANRNSDQYEVFNLGSGQGVTVLEAIQAFEKVTGEKLNYVVGPRRPGDVEAIYSDSTKAKEVLGWVAVASIEDMMASAWKWQQHLMAKTT